MKSMTAIAVLIGFTFAAGSATTAFAESGVPGGPSTKPKVATIPPPPPPRGPDKLVTGPIPPSDGDRVRTKPKVVDDIAANPKGRKPWEQTCNDSVHCEFLRSLCTAKGGGMSTNPDGSETCSVSEGPKVMGSYNGPVMPPAPPRGSAIKLTAARGGEKAAISWTCHGAQSCAYLEYGCGMVGGGMSQNPNGSQTCTVE